MSSPTRSFGYAERFWSKVKILGEDDCWEWQAYRCQATGYGRVGNGLKPVKVRNAHRISYELSVGPIQGGLVVRHTCDNRGCVNPKHLIVGTQQDNMNDAVERDRMSWKHAAKVTKEDVVEIRHRRAAGEKVSDLASEYGVGEVQMSRICTGASWKHAGGPFTFGRWSKVVANPLDAC